MTTEIGQGLSAFGVRATMASSTRSLWGSKPTAARGCGRPAASQAPPVDVVGREHVLSGRTSCQAAISCGLFRWTLWPAPRNRASTAMSAAWTGS